MRSNLERKSGSAGNRLVISGARRSSRSEVAAQRRRLEGGYLLSLRLERRSGAGLAPRRTDWLLWERDGARVPKLRPSGSASTGLLSLRSKHKSGSAVNRLDIIGARWRSRSDVVPQWRRFEGVTLPSIRTQVWSGSTVNRLHIIEARRRWRSEVAPPWRYLKGGSLLSPRLERTSVSSGNRLDYY